MPRTRRIFYDGAIYHIINRGHNQQGILLDAEDFVKFKNIMADYLKKYDFNIFHYCFMLNHFHLIMRVNKVKHLPDIMKGVSLTYANHHKKKYSRVGCLFQSRYKSILIEKDEYLLECGRYIERNPVRAGLVKDPSEYQWSSYNYYAKGKKDTIITPNILYESLGATPSQRMQNYTKYVIEPRPYESLLDNSIAHMG